MNHYKKHVFSDGSMADEHRWLMEQHLGRELATDEVVHHVNENRRDNRIENLQVMTRREHAQHHLAGKPGHPLPPHVREQVRDRFAGEGTHFHKLTEAEVVEMRQLRASGLPYTRIADRYGVHRTTALRAVRGEHWWCVKGGLR